MGDTAADTLSPTVADTATAQTVPGQETAAMSASEPEPTMATVPVAMIGSVEQASPAFTGMLIAASLVLGILGAMNVASVANAWPDYLTTLADMFWIFLGGGIAVGGVFALVGMVVGKQSSGPKKPKAPKQPKPARAKKEKPPKEKKAKK
jgi:hypothetical protein